MRSHLIPTDPLLSDEVLALFNSLPVGIFLADENGIILWVNNTLCNQFRVIPEDLIGRKRQALSAHRVLTLSKSVDRFYVPSLPDKSDRWLECITGKINLSPGAIVEAGCVTDITHHRQLRKHQVLGLEQRDPGSIDPLTGLLNEKAVMQRLAAEVSRSRRYRNPLSLLMIHVIDAVETDNALELTSTEAPLRQIGQLLTDRLRWVDIAGRWSHGDILLVLPETNLRGATHLAEKLYADIMALSSPDDFGIEGQTAIRIAITHWRKGDDAMRLISRLSRLLAEQQDPSATNPIMIG